MGVPKFFRWCAERYPSVITPFKDSPPPVDNLYLDINGIIHNCTHPNDIDATRRAPTEKEMIQGMFVYLEKLFNAIQPRKHFLLAVDGVAPRAKMNQQRQRRYRAGYEMMVAREEALAAGEDVPAEADVFDSNCITPGTPFMVRVSQEFQYFITMKIATDPAWQTCTVVFSGHDNPGEGEHKIVDFIRRRKSQPGYDPNETHCMYGLDADLVMLALATHEPHFVLLREVVTFGPGSRKERMKLEEDTAKGIVQSKALHKADEFVLFHINVLRDYLEMDVRERLSSRGFAAAFDLERVLDDFVFMCFFIGNDFLPTLPTVGINDGSMLTMLDTYVSAVLSKGNFLTRQGTIDWRVTEQWLAELGKLEFQTIRARQQEEADYQRRQARFADPSAASHEVTSVTALETITSIEEYKERYYRDKHGFQRGWDPTGPEMRQLNLHYLEGLSWVIGYYYQGVPSWQWFFPHYYAPMASDLVNLPALAAQLHFELGRPFLPHQQLLAVLPPMSYRSIPAAYWPLLKSPASPLARFFPEHIQIDREGARAPWEGIVIIPFIEEDVLLAAYESVQGNVSAEDARNNVNGPSLAFRYDPQMQPYDLPDAMFGPLRQVLVRREVYHFPELVGGRFVPRLCDGVCLGAGSANSKADPRLLEGFSSLRSMSALLSPAYEVGAVNVFGMPTRKESMLLRLAPAVKSIAEIASIVGREIFVGFPHYKRARVAAVSDVHATLRAEYGKDGNFIRMEESKKNRDEASAFLKEAETHQRYMKSKLGIAVEEVAVLVYVHRFTNMRMTNKNRVVRQYASAETGYPYNLCRRPQDLALLEDSRYAERDRAEADTGLGAKCVYIGREAANRRPGAPNIRGCCGAVVGESGDQYQVMLKVYTRPVVLPRALREYAAADNWVALHEAASAVGVSARTLSTLCSSITTSAQYGSRELGLCLKFTGRSLARVGYAKMVLRSLNPWYMGNVDVFARMAKDGDDTGHHLERTEKGDYVGGSSVGRTGSGTWYLSRAALELVRAYTAKFAPFVEYLEDGGVNCSSVEPPAFMTRGAWLEEDVEDVLDSFEEFIAESGVMDAPMAAAADDVFPNELLSLLEDTLEGGGDNSNNSNNNGDDNNNNNNNNARTKEGNEAEKLKEEQEKQKEKEKESGRPFRMLPVSRVYRKDLYFPVTRSSGGHLVQLPLPVDQSFRLGDRVLNCRVTGSTPFGAYGTIVRLLESGREAEVVYDEPFTAGNRLDGRLRAPRAAITKLSALLVLRDKFEEAKELQEEILRVSAIPPSVTANNNNNNNNGKASSSSPSSFPLNNNNNNNNNNSFGGAGGTHITARGGGGINLSDLANRIPSAAASPATINTNNNTNQNTNQNNNKAGGSGGTKLSHEAAPFVPAGAKLNSGQQQQQQHNNNQNNNQNSSALNMDSAPRVIPDLYVSGRLRVTYRDAALKFDQLAADQLSKALNEIAAAGAGKH